MGGRSAKKTSETNKTAHPNKASRCSNLTLFGEVGAIWAVVTGTVESVPDCIRPWEGGKLPWRQWDARALPSRICSHPFPLALNQVHHGGQSETCCAAQIHQASRLLNNK